MLDHAQAVVDALQKFEFGYPFVMAAVWVAGGVFFWWFEERSGPAPDRPPILPRYPRAAVIVPCHDEARHIAETVDALSRLSYPDYEIVVVDDGSTDDTARILEALSATHDRLRVVRLPTNRGKATALRAGALLADAEYLICIDGDAVLDEHALTWMVRALMLAPRVGGVTGNPRIRTRATVLGRLQLGEFSSLVGLIKRAQMVWGRLFTVSGVVCGFRKSALADVGYWNPEALTDDVDISWRLQLSGWRIRFEPRALCWILMPETLRGLWRQRLRWATGAVQVFVRYLPEVVRPRSRGMWLIAADYATSVAWAVVTFALSLWWIVGLLPGVSLPVRVGGLVPGAWGVTLGMMFLLQIAVGMALDRRYEPGIGRYLPSVISYPVVFWLIILLTVIVGLPRALLRGRGRPGTWVSPDRGLERAA